MIAHVYFAREIVISRRCATRRTNERSAQVRIISQPDQPTDPDLTPLTPFPALMTHRAAQLGFRANGTKSSARDPLNPGSTLMLTNMQLASRTITSLVLAIKRRDFRHNDPFRRLTRTCAFVDCVACFRIAKSRTCRNVSR